MNPAGVSELAYEAVSNTAAERHEGSSPFTRTRGADVEFTVRHSALLKPGEAVFIEEKSLVLCGDVDRFFAELDEEMALVRT